MTGPEHYREAERLIAPAEDPGRSLIQFAPSPDVIALAQVHATLALAAATALQPAGLSVATAESRAWSDVAQTPADAQERNR